MKALALGRDLHKHGTLKNVWSRFWLKCVKIAAHVIQS